MSSPGSLLLFCTAYVAFMQATLVCSLSEEALAHVQYIQSNLY